MKQESKKKDCLNGGPKIKVARVMYFREEDYLRLYDEGVMPEENEDWSDIRYLWIEGMRRAILKNRPECRNPLMIAMQTFGIDDYSNFSKLRQSYEKKRGGGGKGVRTASLKEQGTKTI